MATPESLVTLHAHSDVGWVSWRQGRSGFGAIHLAQPGSDVTLCRVAIPNVGRVVRNQYAAAIEDLCRNCLKEYAKLGGVHG